MSASSQLFRDPSVDVAELQRIAADLGYWPKGGPSKPAGVGSAVGLVAAISHGDVVCVKREDWRRLMECAQREEAEEAA